MTAPVRDRRERPRHRLGVLGARARRRRRRPSRRGRPGASGSATTSAGFDAVAAACSAREDHIRVVRQDDRLARPPPRSRRRARRWTGSSSGRRRRRAPRGSRRAAVARRRRRPRRRRGGRAALGTARSSRSSRSRGLAVHVRDLDARRSSPRAMPSESAAPGSSVWTCTFSARRVADDEQRVAEPLELAPRARPRRAPRPRRRRPCSSGSARAPGGSRRRRPPRRRRRLGQRLARERRRRCPRTISTQPGAAGVDDARLARGRRACSRRARDARRRRGATSARSSSGGGSPRRRLGLLGELADRRSASSPRPACARRGRRRRSPRGARRDDGRRRSAAPSDVGGAAHDLREDHAGVAARAHQRGARDLARERGAVARPRPSSASTTARTVSVRFVPVSPSGTG